MKKKKILLAMIEAGGGHKSPALATQEALNEYFFDKYDIVVSDFTRDVGAIELDDEHKKQWQFLLANPAITMTGYYIQDSLGSLSRAMLKDWMKEFVQKGGEWLKEHTPDVFVSYHFMNTVVGIEARKEFNLKFPILTYLTEPLDAHAMWVWPETDIMMVSSAKAKYKLTRRGFPGEKVFIVPYPVRPSFFKMSRTKQQIQKQYGVNPQLKTVLLSSGAEGLGKIEQYSQAIIDKGLPVNLIVICGRNGELKATLDHRKENYSGETNFIPLGYVTNMNELLFISDLAAVKASPGSTFEALLLKKHVVHMQYVTPSEQQNTKFIEEEKIGWYAPTKTKFLQIIKKFVDDDPVFDEYKRNLYNMNLSNGSYEIAKLVDWMALI